MTHKFWGFTRRTKWNVKCFHHQVLQQSTKPSFYLLTFQIIGSLTLQQPRCLITQQHSGVIISSQQVYVLYVFFIGTCSVVTQQSLWDNGAKLQLSAVLNLATRGSTTLSLTWETSKWILSQLKDLKSGQGPRSGSGSGSRDQFHSVPVPDSQRWNVCCYKTILWINLSQMWGAGG